LTEGGRIASYIHGYIKDGPTDNLDQFPLRMAELVVQSPEDTFDRVGVVVLHKNSMNATLLVSSLMIGLEKIATIILEDLRLNDYNARERGVYYVHGLGALGALRSLRALGALSSFRWLGSL